MPIMARLRIVAYVRCTLHTRDVVWRVDHLAHDAGNGGLRVPRQAESPGGHRGRVQEDVVDARDVERHARREHDARLGLAKIRR